MTPRRTHRLARLTALAVCLAATSALAQGTSVLLGKAVDASTKQPLPDVVVTASSPALQGERTALTDASGDYRIAQLPPGSYTLRFEAEGHQVYTRSSIPLRLDQQLRVNVELLPESLTEEVIVTGQPPTVDVGSTSTGVNVDANFLRNIAVVSPGGKGSATRS